MQLFRFCQAFDTQQIQSNRPWSLASLPDPDILECKKKSHNLYFCQKLPLIMHATAIKLDNVFSKLVHTNFILKDNRESRKYPKSVPSGQCMMWNGGSCTILFLK